MPGMPYKIMSIVTRKLEGVNHFHYYLCRQLKGGGMEIFMKGTMNDVFYRNRSPPGAGDPHADDPRFPAQGLWEHGHAGSDLYLSAGTVPAHLSGDDCGYHACCPIPLLPAKSGGTSNRKRDEAHELSKQSPSEPFSDSYTEKGQEKFLRGLAKQYPTISAAAGALVSAGAATVDALALARVW